MHWVTTAAMIALAGVASPALVGMKSRWEAAKSAFGVVLATPVMAIVVGFVFGLVFGFPPSSSTAQPTAEAPAVVAQARRACDLAGAGARQEEGRA